VANPVDLRALEVTELDQFLCDELAEPRYRAEQVWRWVHERGVCSFAEMTNLPQALRARLAQTAALGTLTVETVQRSRDGTRKLRLRTRDGRAIESVLIPDGDKLTQCISSQVGCALDCSFCATATLGLQRNLDAGEIVDQVYRARQVLAAEEPERRITNLVYMGMGEPLHNYREVIRSLRILTHERGANLSHRRITVSTVGLVPGIEKLGREPFQVNLAVSLNATTDEVRTELMPVNRKYPIRILLDAIRRYPLDRRRRVTFEYVLIADKNDSLADASRLAGLLAGMRCKVNIIPWNPHPHAPYRRPSTEVIAAFQNQVKRLGLPTYLRTPRGDDIDAACGQLALAGPGQATGAAAPVALRIRPRSVAT
jgi:23S rRNA (adenine2503-C2)-methyltransferase